MEAPAGSEERLANESPKSLCAQSFVRLDRRVHNGRWCNVTQPSVYLALALSLPHLRTRTTSACLAARPPACLPAGLSVCLSVCPSVCLSTYRHSHSSSLAT